VYIPVLISYYYVLVY